MFPLFTNEVLPGGTYRVRIPSTTNDENEYKILRVKTRINKEFNDGLFADDIWPGAVVLSDFLCDNPTLCAGKHVVELGAGGALPSLVALSLGAKRSLITDFPGSGILENIQELLRNNGLCGTTGDVNDGSSDTLPQDVTVAGLKWGQQINLEGVWTPTSGQAPDRAVSSTSSHVDSFDLVLLAELLWKDTYPLHAALLDTVVRLMHKKNSVVATDDSARGGTIVLCSFAHRPTDAHKSSHDLEFLQLAESKYGLCCEKVLSRWLPDASGGGGGAMFDDDSETIGTVDSAVLEKLALGQVEVFLYRITDSR